LKRAAYSVLVILGIITLFLNLISCNSQSDICQQYILNPVSDARILPYQFVLRQEFHHINDAGNSYVIELVPLDLYGDEVTRMYAVQSGWTLGGDLSSIVFYEGTNTLNAIVQKNITTSGITSHLPCDIDDNDTLEILIAYVSK